MKKIGELLPGVISDLENRREPSSHLNEEAKKLVDMLFSILETHVTYFRLNHPDGYDAAKREWTKTFIARSVTLKLVQKGIKTLRDKTVIYKSITPSEFLSLCQPTPEELGAPSLEKAFDEACRLSHPCESNKTWSHPAVRLAAHETGSFFLVSEPTTKTFPLFQANYLKAIDDFINGKVMDRLEFDNDAQEQETRRKQKIIAEGFETITSPRDHIKLMKSLLR